MAPSRITLDDGPRGGSLPPPPFATPVAVFSALWAVGHLAHTFRKEPFFDPFSWLLVLASVLLLQRPSSPGRLALLGLAQLALFADRMPVTDNHMYIVAFVNAGLLVLAVPLAVRGRPWHEGAVEVARNYVVAVFLLSYFAAALAKLNQDFLFSPTSCSLTMLDDAASVVGADRTIVPTSARGLVPFGVAGIELAIPLLLAVRRLRPAGVTLAVVFHLSISLSPTATAVDFTVVIFAVLALLVPVGLARTEAVQRALHPIARLAGSVGPEAWGALLLFGTMAVLQWHVGTVAGNRSWALLAITAVVLGIALVAAVWRSPSREASVRLSLRRLHPAHYALLGLSLLNVASPYLGVKTSGTYTMYSNLDTFDHTSNHYLFPRLLADAPLDDLVEIVATSNEKLRSIQQADQRITWHELRRILARDPEASIQYLRGGRTFTYERASDNPELTTLDPVLHKLIAHRPQAEAACLW